MALLSPLLIARKRNTKAVANASHILKTTAVYPTDDGCAVYILQFCYLGRGQEFLHRSSIAVQETVVNELPVAFVVFDAATSFFRICYNRKEREGSGRTDGYHLRNKMLLTLKQSLSFGVCASTMLDSGMVGVFITSVRPKLDDV
jgi:hypothetical protein